jgi:hypothetical protein
MIWFFLPMLSWLLTLIFAATFGEVIEPIDKMIWEEYVVITTICYIVLTFVKIKKSFFRKETIDNEG